jgi:uncharacterized membrane protein HdeD (DUF308 family)
MNRTTTRWLIISGILLTVVPLAFSSLLTSLRPAISVNTFVGDMLAILVILAVLTGIVLIFTAAIGALVKLRQLRQDGWFWAILASLLSIVVGFGALLIPLLVLVYSFAGPTTPAVGLTGAPGQAPLEAAPPQPDNPSPAKALQGNGFALVSFLCALYVLVTVGLTVGIATQMGASGGQPANPAAGQALALLAPLNALNLPAAVTAVVTGVMAVRRAPASRARRGLAWIGLILGALECTAGLLVVLLFLVAGFNGF